MKEIDGIKTETTSFSLQDQGRTGNVERCGDRDDQQVGQSVRRIYQWKRALPESASGIFERGDKKTPVVYDRVAQGFACQDRGAGHHQRFFGQRTQAMNRPVSRNMIKPKLLGLSVGKQCVLLSIAQSSFYYEPKGKTEMHLIDKQFLETSVYGVRQMTWHLRNEAHLVNEKRIRRLMQLMILMLIYQKLDMNKTAKGHKVYWQKNGTINPD